MTYITAGEIEVRAWTIVRGTKAPQAAGKIHTDFERGFIRAETFPIMIWLSAGVKRLPAIKGWFGLKVRNT